MLPNTARVLDGKWLSAEITKEIASLVATETARRGRSPGLAVILVGENPASQTYVKNKENAARKCGFETFNRKLPAGAAFEEIKAEILALNTDLRVDGILLQLPLPPGLDAEGLVSLIDPLKDADGLHELNQGQLLRGLAGLRPCTPLGVLRLLDLALAPESQERYSGRISELPQADLSGKRLVVLGRSFLVGKPLSLMLLERNATVTTVHSRSRDIEMLCREADILVAAVGRPEMVKASWVKRGAIVIDVGINRLESGERAGKLVGDVDFEAVSPLCSALTPVPGGVGPMTVAMLMHNTLQSYLRTK